MPAVGPAYARYDVLYRHADTGDTIHTGNVVLSEGYTTFESIRTILSVKRTGRQDPESITILSLALRPVDPS